MPLKPEINKSELLGSTQVSPLLGGQASRLAGGLNLLAAGDDIQTGEAIVAQNWRTDQAGMLRSRKGHTLVRTLNGYVHTIQTVQRVSGNVRYYGADDKLYREGVQIDTGFDSNPLGVVSFQNRLWAMNPNKQKKDDGANYWNWTPAAPVAAPTASIPAGTGLIGITTNAPTTGVLNYQYTYYAVGVISGTGAQTSPSPGATTVNFIPPIGNSSVTLAAPTFADAAIDHWNIYRQWNAAVALNGAPGNRAYLLNASPLAIASTFTDDGTAGSDETFIETRNLYITIGSVAYGGNYNYYVTGVTALGEESNPSPLLNVTTSATGVTITRPAITDPQITQWNLYRSGGNNDLPAYLVNATPIALATTTFLDRGADDTAIGGIDTTDEGLLTRGFLMRTDRTPAPAAKGVVGPYFGKLLAFNSGTHPNRVWWTPSDEPYVFPGADSEIDGNWVDVGEAGEPIVAIAVFPRWVAIQKGQTVYRMVGDPDDWNTDIERTNAEVGLIGARAWAIAGSTVFLQAQEGVYAFNGDQPAGKISPQLDPIFKGDSITTFGVGLASINTSARTKNCMAYQNGRLYFSYADGANSSPNITAVWEGGRWVTDTRGWTALYYEGQGLSFLGATGGSVYAIGSTATDSGAAIPMIYQSRFADQGAPENRKRYSDVLIEHNTGGHTFNVYAYLENGTASILLGSISSTALTQQIFTLDDAEYRNIAIRLESTDAGSSHCEIHTIAVHYLLLQRNARTYDTEKVALEKVSLLSTVEVELEILSGTVTYAFWSGISELKLIAQGTFTPPASLHRLPAKTFPFQLPDGTEARWVRLILTGDNFRCHGARMLIQPYGCYLTGVGEIFRSGDLTFGSPRVKLLQQIRVDVQADATTPGTFLTDLPDGMSQRQVLSLTRTPARGQQRLSLPRDTRGKLGRIEFTAAAPCRLFGIEIRGKVLGEGASGWQWFAVPMEKTPEGFSWVPLPV